MKWFTTVVSEPLSRVCFLACLLCFFAVARRGAGSSDDTRHTGEIDMLVPAGAVQERKERTAFFVRRVVGQLGWFFGTAVAAAAAAPAEPESKNSAGTPYLEVIRTTNRYVANSRVEVHVQANIRCKM